MTLVFYCWLYAGALVFLIGCAVRAVTYARQPIHLRWEIYPVPNGHTGQLKVMIPEILFLKGLWEFNRPMWRVSYPFHLGLYLVAASGGLLVPAAAIPGEAGVLLHGAARLAGAGGAILALAGALGLLARRLTNRELKVYTTAGDIFNLLFFITTLVLLLAGSVLRTAAEPGLATVLRGAATFDTTLEVPPLLGTGLFLGAALAAYIPMTHMSHFIAKYFTYHAVRWDERSPVPHGSMEKRIAEYLMYRPTWAAPHMHADGQRTWGDVATTNPARGGAK